MHNSTSAAAVADDDYDYDDDDDCGVFHPSISRVKLKDTHIIHRERATTSQEEKETKV